ncbi:hypothetical protein [Hymenobacter terricola]|uniref:hypothetical protein n=1 Tax=Hymenobacter terricola TaxID=2819236 RepID=UPI001B313002|nr:hypothetical protein [Hymenobacter terricola]
MDFLHQVDDLLPFLITLQPEESRSLRNIGFDGVPFAMAALDAVRANVDFTRRSFDLAEFEKDVALMESLRGIVAVIAPLAQKIADTYRLAGADVMVTADDIYADLSKDNGETSAVQAPLQIMKKRYAHRMSTAKATPPRPPRRSPPPGTGSEPVPSGAEPVGGGAEPVPSGLEPAGSGTLPLQQSKRPRLAT